MGIPRFSSSMLLLSYFVLAFISADQQVVGVNELTSVKLNSDILQEAIVKTVNANPKAGWKAAMSPRFSNHTVRQFMHILGVKSTPVEQLESAPFVTHPKSLKLPKQFDARKAWPQCSTIGKILACCGFLCGAGCNGGYPLFAWRYFIHHGVVTEECDPYFDSTGCSHPGCEPAYPTPKCSRKCAETNQIWKQSKHFGVSAYKIHSLPQQIMAEVYKNGPVEVAFTVYEDFAHYKSGVYKHITGGAMGGHAVKLIGWGTTDDGEDYWLIANQWNRSWGDDGYFMIRRGTNECGIEGGVVAGMPSSKNLIRESVSAEAAAEYGSFSL